MQLRDPVSGKVIAEVRMRRDAGELNVVVDVLYPSGSEYPYFPTNSNPVTAVVNTTMFGHAAGMKPNIIK